MHAEIYVCTASTHVHTLLSDLVSSAELQTVSFIMVKRMCAGHSDSFTCADIELGSTLMVFLATFFFFFFFKQSLSDSLGGAVDVGCVMLCIVFNLLSHYMPYWTFFLLHSAGLLCSLILSTTPWSFLWILFYSILFYSILKMCTI